MSAKCLRDNRSPNLNQHNPKHTRPLYDVDNSVRSSSFRHPLRGNSTSYVRPRVVAAENFSHFGYAPLTDAFTHAHSVKCERARVNWCVLGLRGMMRTQSRAGWLINASHGWQHNVRARMCPFWVVARVQRWRIDRRSLQMRVSKQAFTANPEIDQCIKCLCVRLTYAHICQNRVFFTYRLISVGS